jgi:hypothetical protein
MATFVLPTVGSRYSDISGESFEVIGLGTRGIAVQYLDGRVELIDVQSWQELLLRGISQDDEEALSTA